MSVILAFGVPSLLAWWWPFDAEWGSSPEDEPVGFLDVVLGPAFAGLTVGRLTTLALDDPNSIGSLPDMLIIRSGVEFWPGVAAATTMVLWTEHRAGLPRMSRVTALAPLAMVGYAAFEAACVFRDGCFGPGSEIGLRPPGVSTRMLPVGWVMAAALLVAAVAVRALATRVRFRSAVIATATFVVAGVRSIGSIWLPHVGDGLTRQHATSIVIAAIAGVVLLVMAALWLAALSRVGRRHEHLHRRASRSSVWWSMEMSTEEKPEVNAMWESAKGRLAAGLAMVVCCGLSMAIAVGIVAFSSVLVVGGLAVAVAVGCVVFMLTFGHRRHDDHRAVDTPAS